MQGIWKFLTPRQIVFGNGASKDIGPFINETDAKKYLIVTGKKLFQIIIKALSFMTE
jgi:alcohol dehydrogenase class IV